MGQPASGVQDNLPASLTSFVGRTSEIAAVASQLDGTRLLTLTGSGGIGKTRLAIEVAQNLREQFLGGLWLVEFGALADPALVIQSIAAVLGVRQAGPRPILELLLDALPAEPALLLLDNCEHLLDACAAVCATLLKTRRHLKVMITSREPLRVPGEVVWRVPPLALPVSNSTNHSESEAIRLFVDRARTVQPSFSLTVDHAGATAEICRRLDGIPLAIELAAAWVKALSVREIAARLDDRFHLLTGGGRTLLPRQQTLKGTLDWSYGLLSEGERVLLRRVCVFEGGWTLEAAESVCAGDAIPPARVLDLLVGLVDKSLIVAESESTPARYRILETTRQYGLELLESSDEAAALRERHAQYFRSLAQQTRRGVLGPRQLEWMHRMDPEQDNARAALRWAVEQQQSDVELEIAAALWDYWWMRGQLSEGLRHVEGALGRVGPAGGRPSEVRCHATHGAGLLRAVQGDMPGGQQRMEEAVALYRAAGDAAGSVRPMCDLASTYSFLGSGEAGEQHATEALRVARCESQEWVLGYAAHTMGQLRLSQGRYSEVVTFCEDEAEIFGTIGDARGLAHALLQWAIAARRMGEAARALSLAHQTLDPFQRLGESWGELGAIVEIAACAVDLGQPHVAARLLGVADALARTTGAVPIPPWLYEREYAREAARAVLGGVAYATALDAGQGMSTAEALEYARTFGASHSAVGTTKADADLRAGLTRREFEVLRFLAQRYSNREIADTLVLSVRTVERHITNIYNKTGMSTRREAEAFYSNLAQVYRLPT